VRVPNAMLRDTVTLERFEGSGAMGTLYAEPETIRAAVQPTSRLVTDQNGRTVTIDALAIIRPEVGAVRPESRITSRGVTYRVFNCQPTPDERRPTHYELGLSRLAARGGTAGSGS